MSRRRLVRRRQKPVKGGRLKLSPCVERHILEHVDDAAAEFNASKSWITAVALADFFGIELDRKDRFDSVADVIPLRRRRARSA